MNHRFVIIFLCVTLVMRLASALGKQTVGAKGRLLCGSKPSAGTLVKLWDEDTGELRMFIGLIQHISAVRLF